MAEFENSFKWSKIRDDLFQECKKKYYYRYYGSWGGWKLADGKARELYVLKNLKTRQMWLGSAVHDAVKELLTGLRTNPGKVSLNITLNNLKRHMKTDLESSKKGLYRTNPKKFCGLAEHEYKLGIPEPEWAQILESAQKMVAGFVDSDLFRHLKSTDANNWLPIEEMQSFRFEGTPVFLQIDFAMRQGEKTFIYDWKTGKMGDLGENIQLGCYSLYALEKWGADAGSITVKKYNLSTAEEQEAQMDDGKIETVKEYIRNSIGGMKKILHGKENNEAREEDFPKTDEKYKCSRCEYRKVCQSS